VFRCCPNVKEEGVFGMKKLVIFTSEEVDFIL